MYTFRKANKVDALQLSILLKQVYINTYSTEGITREFAHFIQQQFAVSKVEADIQDQEKSIWLALNQGHPVGTLHLEYKKPCPLENITAAEINKLYILPSYSGYGIGQQLMQLAEDEMQLRGEKKCWLWVLETNRRAVRFYEQQGYQDIGRASLTLENSYQNIVMLKKL